MHVTKVRPKTHQCTAVDDCIRLRVLCLYSDKSLNSSLSFLKQVVKAFPFPIQRVQTDWGTEFYSNPLQEALASHSIKYCPIKPRSPHPNGKVERSQETGKEKFYALLDMQAKQFGRKQALASDSPQRPVSTADRNNRTARTETPAKVAAYALVARKGQSEG